MRKKITLIGAGSVVFAKKLIGDILQFPELADCEICVMDINPQRLKVAEAMTQKSVDCLKVGALVSATTDRTAAIRNAHYVICTIQVGGYEPSTVVDFEIPAKYGLQQTIGDTLGVGGVFRALRTIPPILEISRDIASVAHPDCLFLNYSNPMAMNCWALDRETGIPHIGLCHSVQHTSQALASYTGLAVGDVTYKVAGINHMAFFLDFKYKGQDAYPLLFKALEDPATAIKDKVRFEMMRRLGYFVTESSEHQSEYVPYFIHHGKKVINEFLIPIDEYRRRCEAIIATWEQEERDLLGDGKAFEVPPQSQEYGSYIIHAREANQPTVVYGNVPNRGLITNLPNGCCVELPVLIDSNGLQPTYIGDLPPQLASICRTNINVQELTVEAALTKKREHIYQAVMMDPHTSATLTLDKIWAMCDEMIEAHQKDGYMGAYAPVIKNTGRAYKGTGDRVIATLDAGTVFSFEEGATNELVLKVDNPTSDDLAITVQVASSKSAATTNSVDIKVAANNTASRNVPVSLTESVSETIDFTLSTDQPHILCRGVKIGPRKVLKTDSQGRSLIQLNLGVETAATGTIYREGESLIVDFKVHDSDIKPAVSSVLGVMAGSALEISMAASDHAAVRTVNIIPGKRGQEAEAALSNNLDKPISNGSIQQISTLIDYQIHAEIPLKEFGIEGLIDSPLIDVRASLSALGDAHSGGSAMLSGQSGRQSSLAYFLQISL